MYKRSQFISILLLVLALVLTSCAPDVVETEMPDMTEAPDMPEITEAPMMTEEVPAVINPDSVLLVTPASGSQTTFTALFNPFNAQPNFPTNHGIFEPLMINNRVTGEIVPWLVGKFG